MIFGLHPLNVLSNKLADRNEVNHRTTSKASPDRSVVIDCLFYHSPNHEVSFKSPKIFMQDESISKTEVAARRRLLTSVVVATGLWVMIVATGALIYQSQFNWPRFLMALVPGTMLVGLWILLISRQPARK
jgi:hypothetical protein